MSFTVVENVRGFFGSRPPLVMFMIFLGSMAVGLITFAYVVRVKDMPNADVVEDWNTFLERVSVLNYCVTGEPGSVLTNASQLREMGYKEQLKQTASRVMKFLDRGQADTTMTIPPSPTFTTAGSLMNVSVMMDLEIAATAGLQRISSRHNNTYITTTLRGAQLGRGGQRVDMEANLTLILPPLGNRSNCLWGSRSYCYRMSVCVTLTAPRQFFPHTRRPDVDDVCLKEPEFGGENHLHLEVMPASMYCINASFFYLKHRYDPTLTAVTTMPDRSAINLHLMHSSYFLFVMVVSLFCYAIIKGRPSKVKVVYSQCPSEKHAPNMV